MVGGIRYYGIQRSICIFSQNCLPTQINLTHLTAVLATKTGQKIPQKLQEQHLFDQSCEIRFSLDINGFDVPYTFGDKGLQSELWRSEFILLNISPHKLKKLFMSIGFYDRCRPA
ncbi:MAG: hypothetical protein DRR06_19275 [Gammaproteobacteria bacterium]|nr:MAG: hypothetical protein DRR06_19275 [Gammaproteobacteria bacterium]